MDGLLDAVADALVLAGSMTWEILWALILGFALSAAVQAVVRKATIVRLLGYDRPRTLVIAAGLMRDRSPGLSVSDSPVVGHEPGVPLPSR